MHRIQQQHWKPQELWQRLEISSADKEWLIATASLTAKIRRSCPNMIVTILSEKWQRPLEFEVQALGLKQGEFAWVRCVILKCDNQDLIYARTVIPNMKSGNPWFALKKLGNQPLGEILFNLKQVKRSPFLLLKTDYSWPYLIKSKPSLARQSVFFQATHPLLLTEVFLSSYLGIMNH